MDEMIELRPQVAEMTESVARTIAETQAEILIAQKIPRNEELAMQKIKRECESNRRLAEKAMYSYPRGGQTVTGPSIRLAEALCRAWGHIDFGMKMIPCDNNETRVIAFAWDKQANIRRVSDFVVRHEVGTKKGVKYLTDTRDIYELTANMGARRMRACMLALIPSHIIDEAIESCKKKLMTNEISLEERVRKMITVFDKEFKISVPMIEARLGHEVAKIDKEEMLELTNIYNSLKDNMTKRSDWFDFKDDVKSEVSIDGMIKLGEKMLVENGGK